MALATPALSSAGKLYSIYAYTCMQAQHNCRKNLSHLDASRLAGRASYWPRPLSCSSRQRDSQAHRGTASPVHGPGSCSAEPQAAAAAAICSRSQHKQTQSFGGGHRTRQASTDRKTAQTSSSARHSSVSGSAIGVTTARTGSDSVVLMQNSITSNKSSIGSSSSSSSSQARQAGVLGSPAPIEPQDFEVTLAANLDYSIAGDSSVVLFPDYSLPNRDPNRRRVDLYSLDYDYGQPHALPQTATSSVNQAARLDALGQRAGSQGATSAFVTGQAVTARVHSTTSSLKGTVTARKIPDNEIFTRPGSTTPTTGQTVTPPVPLVQSGADAAATGSAEQYKLSLIPSVAYGTSAAHSNTDSVPGKGGAVSSVLSYTSGSGGANNRAQSIAVGGCVSIDLC